MVMFPLWAIAAPPIENSPKKGCTSRIWESGRWPVLYEAARIAKPQLDELDCVLMGLFCGPLTLASHLAGVRIFTDVYKNPEFAHEVIKYAGEVGAEAAKFYAEMGCEIIAIVDPVASQIKSETFQEFVTPNSQPAIEAIHAADPILSRLDPQSISR